MAAPNEKISQLPAATPIAGPELMECVQGTPQKNVQTTAGGIISFVATNYALGGNPNAPSINASLANQFSYYNFSPISGQVIGIGTGSTQNAGWNSVVTGGTNTLQEINSLGTTVASSVRMIILTTAAAANSAGDHYSGTFTTSNSIYFFTRALTNQFPLGGFTMTLYFALTAVTSGMQLYLGFCAGFGGVGLGGSQVPSAVASSIALGKDSGDTTLQFMTNNASGSATKTALPGATVAALAGHLLRFSLVVDGAGNVSMSLQDLEPTNPVNGGALWTFSTPASTAKLPPPRAGTGANQLGPHMSVNNGAAGGVVGLGINFGSWTSGFAAT